MPPSTASPSRHDAQVNTCLQQAARSRGQDRQDLLDEAVVLSLSVADAVARKYQRRGIPLEDLVQVARLSLVMAAHRFDPDRGISFLSYAVPTMTGDLRKHFRDHGWSVRPPRRIQEAHLRINATLPELTQVLGRSPTTQELADEVDFDLETVEQAMSAGDGYRPLSLDHDDGTHEGAADLAQFLGGPDPEFSRSEARLIVGPLVDALPPRDRRILELRYVDGLTQREVGEHVGLSQMQVSRILTRVVDTLRHELGISTAA